MTRATHEPTRTIWFLGKDILQFPRPIQEPTVWQHQTCPLRACKWVTVVHAEEILHSDDDPSHHPRSICSRGRWRWTMLMCQMIWHWNHVNLISLALALLLLSLLAWTCTCLNIDGIVIVAASLASGEKLQIHQHQYPRRGRCPLSLDKKTTVSVQFSVCVSVAQQCTWWKWNASHPSFTWPHIITSFVPHHCLSNCIHVRFLPQ
jgi:hypothetical protein